MGSGSRNVKITEIREATRPSVLKEFIQFPYMLYRRHPHWVPPLISEEKKFLLPKHNLFLRRNDVALFVGYKEQRPVGRIAAIFNNDHQKIHRDNVGFFGFFDAIEDVEVAEKLFVTAARWVKERGAEVLRGPTNFSLNNISGVLVEGFENPPSILMPYN